MGKEVKEGCAAKTTFKHQHFAAKNLIVFKWAYFAYVVVFTAWGFIKGIAVMADVRDMGIELAFVFLGHMGHNTYLKHLKERKGENDEKNGGK